MKKVLATFLCILMLCTIFAGISVMPANAAYSGSCGDNLTWQYDASTKTLTISGLGNMSNYKLESADAFNSRYIPTVPWRDWEYIETVEIRWGVTSIGDYAFYGCSHLKRIRIVSGITSVGKYAFYNCINLKSITIPNSVTSIDSNAFEHCYWLTEVNYEGTIEEWCNISFRNERSNPLYDEPIYEGDDFSSHNEHELFIDSQKITKLAIPDSVTSIGRYTFYNCIGLTSITIPVSVTSIGVGAFGGCTGLTSVTIPDSVTSIGNGTFSGCTGLTNLTIGNSVTSIGNYAFYNCTGLTNLTIGNSVTLIGNCAFCGCTRLSSVTIPNSVTSIGGDVFSGCSSLQEITLPFITYQYPFGHIFGTTSYTGGTATTQYYYGSSTSSTTSKTYYIPSSLKKVTITDSEYIPYGAFYNCSNLTSINIPDSVTSIGDRAFYGCTGLKSITIPDSVTSIGRSAFSNCAVESLIVAEGSKTVASIMVVCKSTLKSVTIPDSVTSIGKSAFAGCIGLTSVTIPDSVTSIGESAFSYCTRLTNITIPDSVTSIGESAFSYCTGLKSITIPDSVTSIEYSAFEGCTGLKDIWYGGSYDDRDNIAVGTNNAPIISATWHFNTCKDGEHIFDSACDTTCNNCEWTRKTTHTVVIDNAVASTCTKAGLTAGKHCSVCNAVLVAQTEVPALGHNYNSVVTNPTCTAQGYTTHTCSHCHDSYVDTYTDALGHDYKAVITNPTCTEKGYTTHTCSRCKDSYVDTYVDALGHDWDDGIVTTPPTCTVNGVRTYTCKHDNSHTYTEPINATGHTEVIDKAVDPTCTATGLTEGKHCSACGTVLVAQSVVPALGHTMVNGKCSVCGYIAVKVKFPDVSYTAWYGDSVAYAVGAGLMKGYANGKFGTSDGIQRQDFVVILARLSGDDIDSYAGKSSFKDVPTNAYYAAALAWAKANGVSNGYKDGSFGVGDKVTREQIMTFLYNYAKLKGYDVTVTDGEKAQIRAQYSDFVSVSSYAQEATYWALKNGVISGKQINGKRYISPGSPAQRCEVAAMFYNINEKGIFSK